MTSLANPAPLGLTGFATTTWLLSMVNAGWFDDKALGAVLVMALVYGGVAQFMAGLMEFVTGNTFAFVAFCSYGAFWWTYALFITYFSAGVPDAMVGWYLAAWGLFTFYMWIGTFKENMALNAVFLTLWITYFLLAVGEWGYSTIGIAGGYAGLVCAVCAIYGAAAFLLNDVYGRTVLPVGEAR